MKENHRLRGATTYLVILLMVCFLADGAMVYDIIVYSGIKFIWQFFEYDTVHQIAFVAVTLLNVALGVMLNYHDKLEEDCTMRDWDNEVRDYAYRHINEQERADRLQAEINLAHVGIIRKKNLYYGIKHLIMTFFRASVCIIAGAVAFIPLAWLSLSISVSWLPSLMPWHWAGVLVMWCSAAILMLASLYGAISFAAYIYCRLYDTDYRSDGSISRSGNTYYIQDEPLNLDPSIYKNPYRADINHK